MYFVYKEKSFKYQKLNINDIKIFQCQLTT